MWRTLKYEGDTNLNSYKSTDEGSPAFNLALGAQYFPGAHVSNRWYSDLGLDFDLDYAIGLKSKQGGKELDTTAYESRHRGRLPHPARRLRAARSRRLRQALFDVDVPPTTPLARRSTTARSALGLGHARSTWWTGCARRVVRLPARARHRRAERAKRYGDKVGTGAWEAGGACWCASKSATACAWRSTSAATSSTSALSNNDCRFSCRSTGTDSYLRADDRVRVQHARARSVRRLACIGDAGRARSSCGLSSSAASFFSSSRLRLSHSAVSLASSVLRCSNSPISWSRCLASA